MHKSSGSRQQPVFASWFTHSLRISFFYFTRRRCIEERWSSNKNINKIRRIGKGEDRAHLLMSLGSCSSSLFLCPYCLVWLAIPHRIFKESRLSSCTQKHEWYDWVSLVDFHKRMVSRPKARFEYKICIKILNIITCRQDQISLRIRVPLPEHPALQ